MNFRQWIGERALKRSEHFSRKAEWWRLLAIKCFTGRSWDEITREDETARSMIDPPFGCPPDVPFWGKQR